MKWAKTLGLLLLLAAVAGLGCSRGLPVENGVIVRAKLLQNGQPLGASTGDLPPGMEDMAGFEIGLVPEGGGEAHLRGMYYGEYSSADGLLVFKGPGKGVPAGRYTLTVRGQNAMPGDADNDPFGAKFGISTSPFKFDIPPDKLGSDFDLGEIDLEKPPQ